MDASLGTFQGTTDVKKDPAGSRASAIPENPELAVILDGKLVYPGNPEAKTGQRAFALYDEHGECAGRFCSRCGEPGLWNGFHKFKSGFMGHQPHCKQCDNEKKSGKPKQAPAEPEPAAEPGQETEPAAGAKPAAKPKTQPDPLPAATLEESEGPSKEEILSAVYKGSYDAMIEVAAGVFERIAANIRKGAKA